MSDSLRDRIIKAIDDEPEASSLELHAMERIADAVIAELGVREVAETGEIVDRDGGPSITWRRHRYVTEWVSSDG